MLLWGLQALPEALSYVSQCDAHRERPDGSHLRWQWQVAIRSRTSSAEAGHGLSHDATPPSDEAYK